MDDAIISIVVAQLLLHWQHVDVHLKEVLGYQEFYIGYIDKDRFDFCNGFSHNIFHFLSFVAS